MAGRSGNPGRGYGSYILFGPDGVIETRKLDYADHGPAVTNNQAEYLTLINALESLSARLGTDARTASVSIWGDSNLVVNQINGELEGEERRTGAPGRAGTFGPQSVQGRGRSAGTTARIASATSAIDAHRTSSQASR